MADDEIQPVAVSRRIPAAAPGIFQVLADPTRHPDFDGSGMVRGAVTARAVSGLGDVFIVTEIYDCSRAPADERVNMENGKISVEGMTKTLERLEELCTSH